MAVPSMVSMPSMPYTEYSAPSYLGHDHSVLEYYNPAVSSGSHQQLTPPIMSRTPSFANTHDHYTVNGANHLVSPAPSGDTTHDHFGHLQDRDAVYPYTADEMTQRRDSDESTEGHAKPYAALIYEALMSKMDKRMVLREIYAWFEKNTDKAKDPASRGWQNSIRHNLSMNGAFRKEELPATAEDGKKGYVWVLDRKAIEARGVESTTRFRKPTPNRGLKRETATPATARNRTGVRKAGRCQTVRRPTIKTEPVLSSLQHVSHAEPVWSGTHGLPGPVSYPLTSLNMQQNGNFDDGHYESYVFPPTPNSITPSPTSGSHSFSLSGFSNGTSLEDRQGLVNYAVCTSSGLPSPSFAFNFGASGGYSGY